MLEQFAQDQALLREELARFLQEQHLPESLQADVQCLLSAPGKLFASSPSSRRLPDGFWGLLPLSIAHFLSPSIALAPLLRVALACELLLCALDFFDEIEDDDTSFIRYKLGDARLLNCAITLLTLSHLLLHTCGLSPDHVNCLLAAMDTCLIKAEGGQHRDLLNEQWSLPAGTLPEVFVAAAEDAISIAAEKSGTLLCLVCQLAAISVDATTLDHWSQVGTLIGIAGQIENDTHDLETLLDLEGATGQEPQKSDLSRRKKTLPYVLSIEQFHLLRKNLAPADREKHGEQEERRLRRSYEDAITAALASAMTYRLQAKDIVERCIEPVYGSPLPFTLRALLGIESL